MKELIIRITDASDDIELLKREYLLDTITEKKISFEAFAKAIIAKTEKKDNSTPTPILLPKNCIGYSSNKSNECYVIHQPEHKRFITLASNDGVKKAYKINYPNSIFVVKTGAGKISTITHYMYVKWDGLKTQLYYPAMPNTTLNICIGNADTSIKDGDLIATLESIIYAPYSHTTVDNVKSFKKSKDYFEYLTNNHIEERYLKKHKYILGDIFNLGGKGN